MKFATDKIAHGYLPAYLRIAAELGPEARVCEVGVEHGHGLDLFQALYPAGLVCGVDSNGGCRWPPGTASVICDQDSPTLPGRLLAVSSGWDLIVDDASHDGGKTAATFALLWPLVTPGGYYAVEDWMVGLGWPGWDDSMLTAVQGLLGLLTRESDVESIGLQYGLAVVRKRRLEA